MAVSSHFLASSQVGYRTFPRFVYYILGLVGFGFLSVIFGFDFVWFGFEFGFFPFNVLKQ